MADTVQSPIPARAPDADRRARGTRTALAAASVLAVLAGAGGALAGAAGNEPGRVWTALAVNALFFSGLALGAVLLLAVTNITAARWVAPFRPAAAAFAAFLPAGVFLLGALMAGLGHVLPWVAHGAGHRAWWLDASFLALRDVAGLVLVGVLGLILAARSRAGAGSRRLSVVYALSYVLVLSLLAVDLVMSRDPDWMSTLFPAYLFVGSFTAGLAAVTALAAFPGDPFGLRAAAGPAFLSDLGTLTLGFALFTGYLFYTQVLVIWYGNLPLETSALIRRGADPGWAAVALAVVGLCFALPFALMPLRALRRDPRVLFGAAAALLAGLWLARWLSVGPPPGGGGAFPLGWIELAVSAGCAGLLGLLWRAAFARLGAGAPGGKEAGP